MKSQSWNEFHEELVLEEELQQDLSLSDEEDEENEVSKEIEVGKMTYSALVREFGAILDDVIANHLEMKHGLEALDSIEKLLSLDEEELLLYQSMDEHGEFCEETFRMTLRFLMEEHFHNFNVDIKKESRSHYVFKQWMTLH